MVLFPQFKMHVCYLLFSLVVVQWKMLVMEMETFQTLQDVENMEGAWDPCGIPPANVIQVGPDKIVATRRCPQRLSPNRM